MARSAEGQKAEKSESGIVRVCARGLIGAEAAVLS